MAKLYIPEQYHHLSKDLELLFCDIKNKLPNLVAFVNDNDGTVEYFKVGGDFSCAKCYKKWGKSYIEIKKDVSIVGFGNCNKFELPKELINAKKMLCELYGKSARLCFEELSQSQKKLIVFFEESLKDIIAEKKIVNNYRLSFKCLYSETYDPFWITIDENDKLIFRYRTIAPLEFEQEISSLEIEKNKSSLNEAIYKARAIVKRCEYFDELKRNPLYQSILDLPNMAGLSKLSNPYIAGDVFILEMSKEKVPVTLEVRNNQNIKTIVPKVGKRDKGYFSFDEDGLMKAFEVITTGKISDGNNDSKGNKESGSNIEGHTKKNEISAKGQDFLELWRNLFSPTAEELQLLFDYCDEIPEEDFSNPEISQAYEKLSNHPLLNGEKETLINIISSRSIYVKHDILDKIKDNSFLDEVIKNMRTLSMKELMVYFKSRRLVYIYGFWKIRIRNTQVGRLVFVTGDKLGKNRNDIYIYDYIEDHKFDFLRSANFNVNYELLCKNVELDDNQKTLSESFHIPYKPLICTGCAGSGKTLISVQMYHNIVEEFFQNQQVNEINLIYLTYNQNTVNSVRPLILDKTNNVNAKTIEEFFRGIIGDSLLSNFKIVNDVHFNEWWNNDKLDDITDFRKKNSLLEFKKTHNARYAYTFFRGFFKGSLFKMEITFETPFLSNSQFASLIISKHEPLSSDEIDKLYSLFSLYQDFLTKNKLIDDNDLARLVSKKVSDGVSNQYERIIVDEVQDLTEVQLDAIIKSSSDKKKLYFFGDQNQSINPTLFDINTIQRCLKSNLINEIIEPYKMNKSYRVGPLLADYINHLTEIINSKIGSSGDNIETSALTTSETKWGGKTYSDEVASLILQNAIFNAKAMIIVPDIKTLNELVKKYGDEIKERVVTIYDSKGLEWDYVVLYNMLSFNNSMYEDILQGKAYNSTLHRMIFNQYYVGCTRAHVCFAIIELNASENVTNSITSKLTEITKDNVNLYISEDNSAASWESEGIRLFNLGEYKLAKNAFSKIKDSNVTKLAEVCEWMLKENYNFENAMFCRNNKLFKEAKIMFDSIGMTNLSKLMSCYLGTNLSETDILKIISQEKLNDSDMEQLNKNGFFDKKVNCINHKINDILISLERSVK